MTTDEEKINKLDSESIKKKLLATTIGGAKGSVDRLGREAQKAFARYIKKALGGTVAIRDIKLLRSKVSLNSIMANAVLTYGGEEKKVFLKIHLEKNSASENVKDSAEYANAELLQKAGWPVLAPLGKNTNPDYPLLIYPRVDSETLFELMEKAYTNQDKLSVQNMEAIGRAQEMIGAVTRASLRKINAQGAVNAPVQTLFYARFKEGGRVDQWYTDETLFSLPGLDKPIAWKKLKKVHWNINGKKYQNTIEEIIASARRSLSFEGEKKAFVVMSHGDDHAGNIFIDEENGRATLFDPAFAGENPVALADTKALAHIGYMMMGGMYFDPKLKTCRYNYDETENIMTVEIDFSSTPLFKQHQELARKIIDGRILPLFKDAKTGGAILSNEIKRLEDSLAGCPLLTINIPRLLDAKDGRGIGLLPLVLMLNELKGFESLEYLREKLLEIKD